MIKAFDDVPEHLLRVEEVYEDCISNALLASVLPEDFSAKTLNVDTNGTEIMHQDTRDQTASMRH